MYGYGPSRFQGMGTALAVVAVVGLIIAGITFEIYSRTNHHDVTFTVTSKERVENSDGTGSKYLIFTDDKTYKVSDNLLSGDFSSSDRYGQMEEGKTYTCDAISFRIPLFSQYENLLDCSEVTE